MNLSRYESLGRLDPGTSHSRGCLRALAVGLVCGPGAADLASRPSKTSGLSDTMRPAVGSMACTHAGSPAHSNRIEVEAKGPDPEARPSNRCGPTPRSHRGGLAPKTSQAAAQVVEASRPEEIRAGRRRIGSGCGRGARAATEPRHTAGPKLCDPCQAQGGGSFWWRWGPQWGASHACATARSP